jgi:hypothetical protein
MENFNNWTLSSIDDKYVFNTIENKEYFKDVIMRSIAFKNGSAINEYSLKSWPIEKPLKAFTIVRRYERDNLVVLAGYIKIPE